MTAGSALAFDFDGVIVDSMRQQEKAWEAAFLEVSADLWAESRATVRRNLHAGYSGSRMFTDVAAAKSLRRRLRQLKDRIWRQRWSSVPLMPEAGACLERLRQDFPLAIATSAPRDYVDHLLERHGLVELFAAIVTDDDVASPKPAPDLLREISRRLEAPLAGVCMVGDSRVDAEMAAAAGCAFVLFDTRPEGSVREGLEKLERVRDWRQLVARLNTLDTAAAGKAVQAILSSPVRGL